MSISIKEGMSLEERTALARAIVNVLDQWKMRGVDQVKILALPDGTRARSLQRYREDEPLPDVAEVIERVEFLLAIAEALRTAYPVNPHMGPRWMNQPHRRFRKRTPIQTMLEDGMMGLMLVRGELDCTYAWEQTGSIR